MTRTQPPQASGRKLAAVPAPESTEPKDTVTPWSWDDLDLSLEHAPYRKPPLPAFDIVKEIPAAIARKAETSLSFNSAALSKTVRSGGGRSRVDYRWDLQPVPDQDKGLEFQRLITLYGLHRPDDTVIMYQQPGTPSGRVTARCGDPAQFVKIAGGIIEWKPEMEGEPFWACRYSVRPFEQRAAGRPPGAGR